VHLSVSLPVFIGAVLLISASPGPAMALLLRRTAAQGMRAAVPLVLGLELGLYLLALLASAGFAALVASSHLAFLALKVIGATVLAVLGTRVLLDAWRQRAEPAAVDPDATVERAPVRPWAAFAEGLVVMLANPKAAVFLVSFYPQFVPADRPLFATTAALALVQVLVELCFYLTVAALIARAGAWLRRPRVRRRLDVLSGTVLLGLSVRVLTSTP